jgi:DNA-binding LacI/PurR family transcriptional regulator
MINDRKAAYDAVTYLISKGHKKLLILEVYAAKFDRSF